MLIKIVPPSTSAELCLVTFGNCVLWVCSECWKREEKIVISPHKDCEYSRPFGNRHGDQFGICNCEKLLSKKTELITAIQLLGYAK